MSRPVTRVLAVLELLQTHGRMSRLRAGTAPRGRPAHGAPLHRGARGDRHPDHRRARPRRRLHAGPRLQAAADDVHRRRGAGPVGGPARRPRARARRGRHRGRQRPGQARARDARAPETAGARNRRYGGLGAVTSQGALRQRRARGTGLGGADGDAGAPALPSAAGRGDRARLRSLRPRVSRRPLVRRRPLPSATRPALLPARPRADGPAARRAASRGRRASMPSSTSRRSDRDAAALRSPSRSCSTPTSRPRSGSCSPPPACSSGAATASCSAARWTTSAGSPRSWRGCPFASRSGDRRRCGVPLRRWPSGCSAPAGEALLDRGLPHRRDDVAVVVGELRRGRHPHGPLAR